MLESRNRPEVEPRETNLLFIPAGAILNRLKDPQKFALIGFLLILLTAALMLIFISEVHQEMGSAKVEKQATTYLRPLSNDPLLSFPNLKTTSLRKVNLSERAEVMKRSNCIWGQSRRQRIPKHQRRCVPDHFFSSKTTIRASVLPVFSAECVTASNQITWPSVRSTS